MKVIRNCTFNYINNVNGDILCSTDSILQMETFILPQGIVLSSGARSVSHVFGNLCVKTTLVSKKNVNTSKFRCWRAFPFCVFLRFTLPVSTTAKPRTNGWVNLSQLHISSLSSIVCWCWHTSVHCFRLCPLCVFVCVWVFTCVCVC